MPLNMASDVSYVSTIDRLRGIIKKIKLGLGLVRVKVSLD